MNIWQLKIHYTASSKHNLNIIIRHLQNNLTHVTILHVEMNKNALPKLLLLIMKHVEGVLKTSTEKEEILIL